MPDTAQLALGQTQTPPKKMDAMEMIQRAFEAAIQSGAGLEVVDRILAQQREVVEYNDRLAFNSALRRIQDRLKPIVKDSTNPDTHSRYASAEAVDKAIEDLLAEEKMALTFEPEPHSSPDMLRIVGVLSLGAYSRRYPLDMPADGKGAKGGGVMSRTHATGSAITYGKRYLKNMIFNLRFKEIDDDGNAAANGHESMAEGMRDEWFSAIQSAANQQELEKAFLGALNAAKGLGDAEVSILFDRAKNKRFTELKKAGAL